jgi:Adenylate and Guanylate cyclase catalytic domain
MNDLTKRLEQEQGMSVKLKKERVFVRYLTQVSFVTGPETGDIALRIGLHSGSLTAGVIRGEKAWFQLFGSVVDTAARMEGTGERNRIHVSQQTADLLLAGNKGDWIQLRDGGVTNSPTYWLDINSRSSPSSRSAASSTQPPAKNVAMKGAQEPSVKREELVLDENAERLIKWIARSLELLRCKVVARRMTDAAYHDQLDDQGSSYQEEHGDGHTVVYEVKEIIALQGSIGESVQLIKEVLDQLHDYVSVIYSMYKKNPFHGKFLVFSGFGTAPLIDTPNSHYSPRL